MAVLITVIKRPRLEEGKSARNPIATPLLCLHQPDECLLRRMGRGIGVDPALPPAPDAAPCTFDGGLAEEVLLNLDALEPGHVLARIAAEEADGVWQDIQGQDP